MSWNELKEDIVRVKEENITLKNRCYAFTRGSMCRICTFDCVHKEKVRNEDEQQAVDTTF